MKKSTLALVVMGIVASVTRTGHRNITKTVINWMSMAKPCIMRDNDGQDMATVISVLVLKAKHKLTIN